MFKMANTKHLYEWLVLLLLFLLLLIPNKCESRALPQVERNKKNFMKKSQQLRESLVKQSLIKFPNNFDIDRLSPGGPDPRHH
ncbi:CLAVATA3/ESR-related [Arachis hypogaea]|nr:CLAVATA3/ESR-related [Arachis hypogaea]